MVAFPTESVSLKANNHKIKNKEALKVGTKLRQKSGSFVNLGSYQAKVAMLVFS